MSDARSNDANILGGGTVGGGTYRDVTINGAGRVQGELDCVNLRMNGAAQCEGSVKAETISVNGSGRFGGDVQASEMTVNGDATVARGAGIGRLVMKGQVRIEGGLAAHVVDVKGDLRVGGDLTSPTLDGDGAFTIGGILAVDDLKMRIYGPCRAREIRGRRIRVDGSSGLAGFTFLAPFMEKRLVTDAVHGEDVVLEYTTAKLVRGARVDVGKECDVALVEYTESLRQTPDARVGETRKVAAE